ncbi:MAG: hypothetical protein MJK18_08145, partial [Bdellovibrionales bacterium]|nr:hypothetical protein [Bdellovibrionales bacterium]
RTDETPKNDSEWLFPCVLPWSPVGRVGDPLPAGALPLYPDSISRPLKKYLKAANLPLIPYKNLRQTAANIITELTDLETARTILAHTSSRTTEKHYIDPKVLQNSINSVTLESGDEKLWKIKDLLEIDKAI